MSSEEQSRVFKIEEGLNVTYEEKYRDLRVKVSHLLFLLNPIDWECVVPDEMEYEDIIQAVEDIGKHFN